MVSKEEILKLLSPHIAFDKAQSTHENLAAKCPFHAGGNEHKPSFYLYVGPTKSARQVTGSSLCFTCGRGWSLGSLLKAFKVDRSYLDAILEIIEEESVAYSPDYYSRICFDLPRIPEVVLGAFDYAPKELIDAGFRKEVLKQFDVGYDRPRKRIIFPIRDHLGHLVGMSGRTTIGADPRYKVYKDELKEVVHGYELKKGRVIWGLDRLYTTAMTLGLESPIVVCEGFKATLWCVQNGFDSTVALMGKFCTEEQKLLLSRVTNEVILFLDNNEAGRTGTSKIAPYLASGLSVRIANYPDVDNIQPDDLSRSDLTRAINNAITLAQWKEKYENSKRNTEDDWVPVVRQGPTAEAART